MPLIRVGAAVPVAPDTSPHHRIALHHTLCGRTCGDGQGTPYREHALSLRKVFHVKQSKVRHSPPAVVDAEPPVVGVAVVEGVGACAVANQMHE